MPERKRGRGRGGRPVVVGAASTGGDEFTGLQEWCHFVHFNGWNVRFDRWVTVRDLFHDTSENRKRVSDNIVGKVARPSPTKPKDDARDKKRKRGTFTTTDGTSAESSLLDRNLQLITRACELPFTLQTVLVDDKDKITSTVYPLASILFGSQQQQQQQHQRREEEKANTMLHVIPAPTSIVDLLGQYIQTKKQEDLETFAKYHRRRQRDESGNSSCSSFDVGGDEEPSNMEIVIVTKADLKTNEKKRKEFALSILALVDASLPLFLLYAEEQDQYTNWMSEFTKKDDVDDNKNEANNDQEPNRRRQQPSHLYPAEYLLRLFVKIPYLLSEFDSTTHKLLSSTEKSQDFAKFLSELIVYMQKRVDEIFTGNYQVVEVQD